jgi:hypothetical protein
MLAEIFSSGGLQPCPWLPASENLSENSSEPQPATPLGSSSYLGFKNVQNLCRPFFLNATGRERDFPY